MVMLAFGLGTLPNMLLISGVVGRVQPLLKLRGVRLAVAAVLAVAGLYGILHGMARERALQKLDFGDFVKQARAITRTLRFLSDCNIV